jgi:hypothetical protein
MLLCPGFALGTSGLAGSLGRQRCNVEANRGERSRGICAITLENRAIQSKCWTELLCEKVLGRSEDIELSSFVARR